MRHRKLRRKLGVKSAHRKALLRNMVQSLVIHKRIQTTVPKAKEASAFSDKMVELAKRGDLHARRLLISKLGSSKTADSLIKEIGPKFKDRQGGYTRVLRFGSRPGDGAEKAILEFTETFELPEKDAKKKKKKAKKPTESDAQAEIKTTEKEAEADSGDKKDAEKSDAQKKGGFLGTLRKFLKGDES